MSVKWSDIKIFAVIVLKINQLVTTVENKSEEVNLHELSHVKTLEQVKIKLFSEYHDYLDIFDWAMIDQLSSHRIYDHKIELINEKTFSRSKLYQMFDHKLQKIKKYLIEHLNKEFIFFSFVSYVSLILFAEKKDENPRFCVDYRKLNALIKRDRYSLLLINKILARIQESKYLTRLNIIIAFNKLQMHSDSEDLTIFIIFFDSYKYHVMLFELINESMFYQDSYLIDSVSSHMLVTKIKSCMFKYKQSIRWCSLFFTLLKLWADSFKTLKWLFQSDKSKSTENHEMYDRDSRQRFKVEVHDLIHTCCLRWATTLLRSTELLHECARTSNQEYIWVHVLNQLESWVISQRFDEMILRTTEWLDVKNRSVTLSRSLELSDLLARMTMYHLELQTSWWHCSLEQSIAISMRCFDTTNTIAIKIRDEITRDL